MERPYRIREDKNHYCKEQTIWFSLSMAELAQQLKVKLSNLVQRVTSFKFGSSKEEKGGVYHTEHERY